jgi:mono/diheme cytochrome c family protein
MRISARIGVFILRASRFIGALAILTAPIIGRLDSHAGGPEASAKSSPVADVPGKKAQELFALRCARCHDDDGTAAALRGTMPALPNFTRAPWQQQRSDAQMVVSILEGKGARMPAFAGRLTKAEARSLVRHIRTFAPHEPAKATEPSAPDFDERLRVLQEELERLRKQFYDLGATKD